MKFNEMTYTRPVFNDINRPGIMIEFYLIESMVEMLRQRERMTVADREIRDEARAYHNGRTPPKVTRLLSAINHRKIF